MIERNTATSPHLFKIKKNIKVSENTGIWPTAQVCVGCPIILHWAHKLGGAAVSSWFWKKDGREQAKH